MANIKNFFKGVGNWFKNHIPTRRRIIQVYAALLTNANLKGFAEGQIYQNTSNITAVTKNLCAPGLNCYSCPGAVAACPLGALQNSLGSAKTTTPYYILGIIALLGLLLARTICGFLCPFGFFQDMLYKVKSPKVKKSVYTRLLSYLKYVFLITLVIAVPLIYHNVPGFCKYICPAGTFEGSVGLLANEGNADLYSMLSYLFSWKFVLFVMCVVLCIFIYRAFCRFICPLGAIYGFFNKVALLGVKLEKSKCIDCGMCISKCKMDIKHVGDHECINCGECISVCPTKAIRWKGSRLFLEPTSVGIKGAESTISPAPALNSILACGTTLQTANSNTDTATATVEAGVSEAKAEAPAAQKSVAETKPQMKKVKKTKRKKSAKILEIVAWSLAGVLLIGALVYYNTLPPVTSALGKTIADFTVPTYNTAYDSDEYTLYDNDSKPTVLLFWSTRNEASIKYLAELKDSYEEIQQSANIVAVHVVNADAATSETVQSVIDENGFNEYNIPFVQDTDELKLYSECGGDGAFPTLVFLSIHSQMYSKHVGEMTVEKITEEVQAVKDTTIYDVGDRLNDFTVATYETSYKEGTFSTESARGKVLVINFWYVNCGPCVEELPFIEEVNKEFGDEVIILAIHANDDSQPYAQSFIDNENPANNKTSWSDWDTIFGKDIGTDIYFKMLGGKAAYPITIVVDAEGYITFVRQGPVINAHLDDLTGAIEDALGRGKDDVTP